MQQIHWRRRFLRWARDVARGPTPLLATAGGPDPLREQEPLSDSSTGAAGGEEPVAIPPAATPNTPDAQRAAPDPAGDAPTETEPSEDELLEGESIEDPSSPGKRGIAGKVKKGLISVVAGSYDARADDLEERAVRAMRRALVEERGSIAEVAQEVYDARADDLQKRAVGAVRAVLSEESHRMLDVIQDAYDTRADDLQDRAARALRNVITQESERIRSVIEHSVSVKRREVRISLTVLVVANLIYLAVYYLTNGGT